MRQLLDHLRKIQDYWFCTPATCEFYHYQQFTHQQKRYF